ncbi:hypothetical protein ZEAMMB73_Zm00001d036975 [Zea mays]|uniref:Uncharacterized protein n=1 Tax=Zea mays TaxID=4577 RepID=A0A1D6LSZ4_MAIZE|nr:hypothetical protein ZEAMMB73_Zm00001d036975 [Zea mays]AQK82548.1 hypothetical protein ZEAMMB73_Zm00001d036975 [Zea mays]
MVLLQHQQLQQQRQQLEEEDEVLVVATSVLSPDAEKRSGMWRSQRDLNPGGRSPVQICDPPFSTLQIVAVDATEEGLQVSKSTTTTAH